MAFETRTIDLGSNFNADEFFRQQRLANMQAASAKKKKGFLVDNISTGGGIGGALAGGAAGAALGSAVPVLGTAVGGILGALIGGAGGSAAGQVAENKLVGERLDEGVAQEALLGGATALPFGAALKLGQAGLKVGAGIGKTGARELIEQAGAKTVPGAVKAPVTSNVANRAGKNLEKISGQMLNSQTQVTGSQARRMGLQPVNTMSSVNKRTGLTNFDDMAEVSKSLTGGKDSILDALTREAVGSTTGVKIDGLSQTAQKLLDDKGTLLTDSMRKDIMRNVQNAGTTMFGGSKGSLSSLANPQEALNQANKFRAAAKNIESKGLTATPEQADQAKIYNGLAESIEKQLYSSPGVNQSIPELSRLGANSLREMAGEARVAGNAGQADAYMKIADELSGIKDVKQLRSMKKDFVDVGKMDTVTAQADGARQFNAESASSMIKGSPIKGTLAALTNLATPRVAGKLGQAGRALQGVGGEAAARTTQSIPLLAAREGGARLLTADAPQPATDPTQQMPMDQQFTEQPQQQAVEPSIQLADGRTLTQGVVTSMYAQALASGQMKAAEQLSELMKLFPEQSGPDLSSSTAQLAAKQDTGLSELDRVEQAYAAAGGGQGVLGGNIANALGAVNVNASAGAYNDQLAGRARMLGRALGEVGAGSDSDARAFVDRLPKLTDSPERAAQKIAELRALLQQSRQNTLTYGAGAKTDFNS